LYPTKHISNIPIGQTSKRKQTAITTTSGRKSRKIDEHTSFLKAEKNTNCNLKFLQTTKTYGVKILWSKQKRVEFMYI